MNRSSTQISAVHPTLIRGLHWATLAALTAAFAVILLRNGVESKELRLWTMNLHRTLGLSVWALTCIRLLVRSRLPLADTQAQAPVWQRWAASATHGLMYVFLLGLPLLGLALSNAGGHSVSLPLVGALPAWPAKDLDLADTLQDWHGLAAWSLLALAGAHAAVALWHHHVVRDGVLVSMLPRLARPGQRGSAGSPQHPVQQPSRSFS
jgi:cytochrome b561